MSTNTTVLGLECQQGFDRKPDLNKVTMVPEGI